jgi:hypothetical protein
VVNQARSRLRQAGRDRDKADRFGRVAPVSVGMPSLIHRGLARMSQEVRA